MRLLKFVAMLILTLSSQVCAQTSTYTFTPTSVLTPPCSPASILGSQTGTSVRASLTSGVRLSKVTLSQPATLYTISTYIRFSGSASIGMGIYENNGTEIGHLISDSGRTQAVQGWNSSVFPAPLQLNAGVYWLAYYYSFPSSASVTISYTTPAGSHNFAYSPVSVTLSALPSSLTGTVAYTSNWQECIYAAYCPATTPFATWTVTNTPAATNTPSITPTPYVTFTSTNTNSTPGTSTFTPTPTGTVNTSTFTPTVTGTANTPTNTPTAIVTSTPTSSTMYVPYSGAVSNVDVGHHTILADDLNIGTNDQFYNICIVGDSIQNISPAPYTTTSFPSFMGRPGNNVFNRSYIGQTIQGFIPNEYLMADMLSPRAGLHILIYAMGTNDAWQIQNATQMILYYRAVCNHAHQMGFNKIISCTLPSINHNGANSEIARLQFNTYLRSSWMDFSDGLADIGSNPFLGASNAATNTTYFVDGIHPTAAGSTIIGSYFGAAVSQVVSDASNGGIKSPQVGTTAPTPAPRFIGDRYFDTSGSVTQYLGINVSTPTWRIVP